MSTYMNMTVTQTMNQTQTMTQTPLAPSKPKNNLYSTLNPLHTRALSALCIYLLLNSPQPLHPHMCSLTIALFFKTLSILIPQVLVVPIPLYMFIHKYVWFILNAIFFSLRVHTCSCDLIELQLSLVYAHQEHAHIPRKHM